jgi:1,4-dihydroxy-2-naphthoate polyprenyltransferase
MINFLLAIRPKTLVAAVIPSLMSYSLYTNHFPDRPLGTLALCCLCALFIQIATNLFNDVIDFKKGADDFRHGPVRVTAAGLVSPTKVKIWAYSCLVVAIIFSLPLIKAGGPWIFIPGLISLYLTYGYTGGPWPLAYKGLGELFVFLFFGIFAVCGSYYLFAGKLIQDAWVLGCIYGLLTTTLICVNNLRDREEDQKVGKATLATRLSEKSYRFFCLLTVFTPYTFSFMLLGWPAHLFILLALPVSFKLALVVVNNKGASLNAGLKLAAIKLIVFSISIHLGLRYGYLLL